VDITALASDIGSRTLDFFQIFLWAGLVYLVLTSSVASFLGWLERKTYVPGVTNV
jgi:polar amino acid transport system permease protein